MAGPSTPNATNPGGLLALLNSFGNGGQFGQPQSIDPNTGLPAPAAAPYSGIANLGLQLLANSGPSPVPRRFGSVLGSSMLQAQSQGLQQAMQRQQLQAGQLQLQNQMAMLAALNNPNAAGQGSGLPIDAPDYPSGTQSDNSQASASQNGPVLTPGGVPPTAQQRLQVLGAQSAAPPGAQVPAAPPGAIPGLPGAPFQPQSAAPPGAPAPRQQIMPPGGSGQLPPGFNAFRPSSAAAPNWLTPPTAAQIAGVPVGGFSPQMAQRLALMRGGDPVTTAEKLRAQQLAIAQQKYGPVIAQLDTLTKSDTPTKYVQADPRLAAAWQRIAPQLGMDPQKDFTDQNVRTAFTFTRNQLAGALSEATVAPNVQLKTTPFGVGGSIQTDPVTGKITTGAPQQDTGSFVLPDGSVREMSKAQGIARGLPPFNAETYINPTTVGGTASMIASYKMAPLTAQAMRTAQGQAIMSQVRTLNPDYDATQYTTKNAAREAFATGTQGNTVRSLSVATDHLNQLGQAAVALQNTPAPAWNKVSNFFATQMGHPEVQSFEAMKEVVGDEVVKAVVGSSGAEGDRDAIKNAFAAASSPAQVQAVIGKYKGLMGSQLNGLQRQYKKSTGLDDFNDMVSPAARSQLGGASTGPLSIGQSTNVGGFTVTRTQ